MSHKSDKKETDRLVEMLKNYPQASRIVEMLLAIQKLADGLKFPINSLDEFVNQIKDKQPTVNASFSLDELKNRIPSYYLPFVSKENFLEKAQGLFIDVGPMEAQQRSPTHALNVQVSHNAGTGVWAGTPVTISWNVQNYSGSCFVTLNISGGIPRQRSLNLRNLGPQGSISYTPDVGGTFNVIATACDSAGNPGTGFVQFDAFVCPPLDSYTRYLYLKYKPNDLRRCTPAEDDDDYDEDETDQNT